DTWRPVPHFYDLNNDNYSAGEQVFVPFSTSRDLKLGRTGSMNCWDTHSDNEAVGAPCEWIQFWVELDSADKAAAYKQFLIAYSEEQRRIGNFQRAPNVRLRDV